MCCMKCHPMNFVLFIYLFIGGKLLEMDRNGQTNHAPETTSTRCTFWSPGNLKSYIKTIYESLLWYHNNTKGLIYLNEVLENWSKKDCCALIIRCK